MNSLSWMIYLANVAGSVGGVLTFVAFFSGITGAVAFLAHLFFDGEVPACYSWEDKEQKKAAWDKRVLQIGKLGKRLPVVCACAAVLAMLVPSQNTIYAIAASEMGERALNTPTASKAIKALDAWLDRQIDAANTEPTR